MSVRPDDEVHVAGVVVHTRPDAVARVERAVRAVVGAEVHAASPDGKLVVTLEAGDASAVADALVHIQRLEGVLGAALVYQHSESASAMNTEVDLEDHASSLR